MSEQFIPTQEQDATGNSYQRFKLAFEETPDDMERVTNAIARHTMRQYEKVVLFVTKTGLLSRLRFGRRG